MENLDYESMPLIQEFKHEEWPARFIDEHMERRPPTPEEREKMDRELVELGNLMKDAGIWWQIDGALNISLFQGDYIGVHRDVDVSILKEDISRLEKYLEGKGYGYFLYKKEIRPEDGKIRTLRRVGTKAFAEGSEGWQRRIVKINEKGEAVLDADLSPVDVSLIRRDERGQLLGRRGVIFPEKWLASKTIDFHGASINLSHPARFLFNKIFYFRGTDEGDLKKGIEIGLISKIDIKEVGDLIKPILKEFEDDPDIGKARADLIRERIRKMNELVEERNFSGK